MSAGLVSRRGFVVGAVGVASVMQLERAARAMGFSDAASVCKLAAEQEVGPYYVADELMRANIREGKPGVPLELRLAVLDARTCKPLAGAALDIWHCDAMGIYSGYTKVKPMEFGPGGPEGGPGGPPMGEDGRPMGPPPEFDGEKNGDRHGPPGGGPGGGMKPTDKLTFLRGVQMTGPDGAASFATVFPGVYPGRTNHIHFKVRLGGKEVPQADGAGKGLIYSAGHTSHVGQVFFDEKLCVELMEHEPYSAHKIHRTTQGEDSVFGGQHGVDMLSRVLWVKKGDAAKGLRAELVVAVDPTAEPKAVGPGGGGPRPKRQS